MWTIDLPSTESWSDQPLLLGEVLYQYDEPLIFTANFGVYQALFSRIDELEGGDLYAVSTVDQEIIDVLKSGLLSLRGALLREPCYVMQLKGLQVLRYWPCAKEDLPEDLLPVPGRSLIPQAVDAADVFEQLTSYFSVRFSGGSLTQKSMAFSTFKNLVDGVYAASRKIMMPDGLVNAKSATFDFDVYEPAFGSLVINLDKPKLSPGNIRKHLKNPAADMNHVQQNIAAKNNAFFDELSGLVADAEDGEITKQDATDHIELLKQIQELLPTEDTDFEQVDFHALVNQERRQIVLTEEVGERLRRAHDTALGEAAEYTGRITIVNSKRSTFVIQRDVGRELTCSVPAVEFAELEAREDFRGGTKVVVAGQFYQRARRDYMTLENIFFPA